MVGILLIVQQISTLGKREKLNDALNVKEITCDQLLAQFESLFRQVFLVFLSSIIGIYQIFRSRNRAIKGFMRLNP